MAALSVARLQLNWGVGSVVLSVYVSATPDMHEEAEAFCQVREELSRM